MKNIALAILAVGFGYLAQNHEETPQKLVVVVISVAAAIATLLV